jgi:hypothetical protein
MGTAAPMYCAVRPEQMSIYSAWEGKRRIGRWWRQTRSAVILQSRSVVETILGGEITLSPTAPLIAKCARDQALGSAPRTTQFAACPGRIAALYQQIRPLSPQAWRIEPSPAYPGLRVRRFQEVKGAPLLANGREMGTARRRRTPCSILRSQTILLN